MLKPEQFPLSYYTDRELKRKARYHAHALEGLKKAPDTIQMILLKSNHARRLGFIQTELVNFKRRRK